MSVVESGRKTSGPTAIAANTISSVSFSPPACQAQHGTLTDQSRTLHSLHAQLPIIRAVRIPQDAQQEGHNCVIMLLSIVSIAVII